MVWAQACNIPMPWCKQVGRSWGETTSALLWTGIPRFSLSSQVQAALERVRQGADVMPRNQLESVLRAELGPDWLTLVKDFEWDPCAAASIGQV